MLKRLTLGVALFALAAPLAAQTATTSPPTQPGSKDDPGTPRAPLPADRGYDKPQVRTEAINAQTRDDVARANSTANITSGSSANASGRAGRSASPVQRRHGVMDGSDAHRAARTMRPIRPQYDRRQRAYADAMYVWRMQVRDCERGFQFACNRATPNPADFYAVKGEAPRPSESRRDLDFAAIEELTSWSRGSTRRSAC